MTSPRYVMQSPPGPRTLINDRWRDYFAGCSYLGLQSHPGLLAAAAEALARYGLSAATSRGGYGEHPLYTAVEEAAARYFETERATYFVSGYLGNAILAQGLRGSYERIFVDESAHFSVREGVQTAELPVARFHHLDAGDLAVQLRSQLRPGERPLVISDGVFPISGELAPAADYLAVLADYAGGQLCLDDAHAVGVIGPRGRGTWEYWQTREGLAAAAPVYTTCTLSKALGGHGGVIAGAAAFIERVSRGATTLTATSPSPLPAAAASAWALNYVRERPELRGQLWANVTAARARLAALGWDLADTPAPIICLRSHLGRPPAAGRRLDLARLQAGLFERDICVAHVTSYTSTPAGGALRIAIFATHTTEQIDRLARELAALL